VTTEASEAAVLPNDDVHSRTDAIGFPLDAATAYEALVDLAASLPLEEGPAAVVGRLLDVLAGLMPPRAFGVCLVLSSSEEPLVDMRLPENLERPRRDPTRLFPELDDERIMPLAGLEGSTLHIASTSGPIADGSLEDSIARRAAALLATAARTAMILSTARPASTEVTDLRSQLIQAEKLATLGQVVAGVVHELANPVTSIVACTDFLLKRGRAAGAPAVDLEYLVRIGTAADRVHTFCRDLVTYARPATEGPGPVPIHDVIRQAFAFCEHELSRHEVDFSQEITEGIPPVLGQPGPLTQVFINLFTNAAHAMSDHGGRLLVVTSAVDESARIAVTVTDTGVGIPSNVVPKIFEPFFTTKEKGRGTGLGLSIVREIIRAHRGAVEVQSTPGEGSTFTVLLPVYVRPVP
jgi:two-component system, NtrC family, sensor kinase